MATICNYQHKKFDLKTEEYTHKKFGAHLNKRKLEHMEDKEINHIPIITAQSILEKAQKDMQHQEQPQVKRRQTKPLFRPWMDKDNKSITTPATVVPPQKTSIPPQVLSSVSTNILTYRPNMVRQHAAKARTEKEQQRRNRNTMACLINRRNKQAEHLMMQQQYFTYHQQHAAMMEQSVRAALYLRHLEQVAHMQRQQQLFVFGQQHC